MYSGFSSGRTPEDTRASGAPAGRRRSPGPGDCHGSASDPRSRGGDPGGGAGDGSDRPGEQAEVEVPPRHPRHCRQPLPVKVITVGLACAHGAPTSGSGEAVRSIRSRRRRRSFARSGRRFFYRGPAPLLPLQNGRVIRLQGAADRPLAAPPELLEQAPHMAGVVFHVVLQLNQIGDAPRRPQSCRIPQRLGTQL
jgi:hypothetical protein